MTELSDKEKIEAVNTWPVWPVLPMKRVRDEQLEVGLVTADFPHTIILANMLEVNRAAVALHQLSNEGKVVRDGKDITIHYTDVEGMLDDGWEVD